MPLQGSTAPIGKLARGTVVICTMTAFGLGANYLFGVYVARQLGAHSFGLYSIGLSLFNMLGTLSVMGLNSAVLHFVPGAWAQGHQHAARSALRHALWISLLAGSAAAIGLCTAAGPLARHVFADPALLHVLPFFAAAIPGLSVGTVLLSGLQALHDVKWRMLIKYVVEPATKFVVAMLLIWLGWQLHGVLAGFIASLCVTAALAWLAMRHRVAGGGPHLGVHGDRKVTAMNVVRYTSPLLAGMLFNVVATRSDVLLIGHFLSTSEAGVYAAAVMTSGVIALVLQSVESTIAAPLSESMANSRTAEAADIYRLSLRWVVIIGAPLVLVFTLWPAQILAMFGDTFREGATAFVILALAQSVNLATGSANQVLLLSGRSRLVMVNEILNGVLQIGLNLYLIPRYGIVGAALGLLAAIVVVNTLRLIQVWRHVGIQPYDWFLLKPLAAAAVAFVLTAALGVWMETGISLWFVPVPIAVFAICLLALGLHEQDRAALAWLSPRRLGR